LLAIQRYENFNPFALAEARIYDQAVIANGLSTQKNRFTPTIYNFIYP
jgi:phosphohistidine phosphatase